MDNEPCAWEEQEIYDRWINEYGLVIPCEAAIALKEAFTKPRIEKDGLINRLRESNRYCHKSIDKLDGKLQKAKDGLGEIINMGGGNEALGRMFEVVRQTLNEIGGSDSD